MTLVMALGNSAPLVTSLPSRGLRRTMGRGCCTALRMSSLVEQAVTADEAIALINKAKSIVEGDMGVKVNHPPSQHSDGGLRC